MLRRLSLLLVLLASGWCLALPALEAGEPARPVPLATTAEPPPAGSALLFSLQTLSALALGAGAPRVGAQELTEGATLEVRAPEVQWAPAGTTDWQAVAARQAVRAGDSARTSTGASARLVYFEGTTVELGRASRFRWSG